jgi:hypothetical protein
MLQNEKYLSAMNCNYETKYCEDKIHKNKNHDDGTCIKLINVKIIDVDFDLLHYNLSGIKSRKIFSKEENTIDLKCLELICKNYKFYDPNIWEMKIENINGEKIIGTKIKDTSLKEEIIAKLFWLNSLNDSNKLKKWILL